jgi:multidrug resistance efflux pump
MKAMIDWKAFNEVNALSTTGLMSGEEKTLCEDDATLANAALKQARDTMRNVQTILESARQNWRNRHLSHRPLLAQTLDA